MATLQTLVRHIQSYQTLIEIWCLLLLLPIGLPGRDAVGGDELAGAAGPAGQGGHPVREPARAVHLPQRHLPEGPGELHLDHGTSRTVLRAEGKFLYNGIVIFFNESSNV